MRPLVVVAAAVAIATFSFAGTAAKAGYVIEQEAITPNPVTFQPVKATVRSWHEGKRFKRENPLRNEVVIIDLDKREVVGLNATNRTYWRLPAERYRQLALVSLVVLGVSPRPDGTLDVPDPLFVPTGVRATVEGRDAYQVKVQGKLPAGVETELWLSESVPLTTETLVDELRLALGDPKDPSFQHFFAQWRALKGYPVQSVTTVNTARGRVVSSETLLSIREQKIDPSVFAVPPGFTLTEDPIAMMERLAAEQRAPAGIGAPLKSRPPASSPATPPGARSP
jgi:hypothetical protein